MFITKQPLRCCSKQALKICQQTLPNCELELDVAVQKEYTYYKAYDRLRAKGLFDQSSTSVAKLGSA